MILSVNEVIKAQKPIFSEGKVAADENWKSLKLTGNFGFLTQMRTSFIQPP